MASWRGQNLGSPRESPKATSSRLHPSHMGIPQKGNTIHRQPPPSLLMLILPPQQGPQMWKNTPQAGKLPLWKRKIQVRDSPRLLYESRMSSLAGRKHHVKLHNCNKFDRYTSKRHWKPYMLHVRFYAPISGLSCGSTSCSTGSVGHPLVGSQRPAFQSAQPEQIAEARTSPTPRTGCR